MKRLPSRAWRVLGTGIAFATFGVGGIVLGLLVLPVARLLPGTRREREFRCQRVVHRCFRIFVRMSEALGLLSLSAAFAKVCLLLPLHFRFRNSSVTLSSPSLSCLSLCVYVCCCRCLLLPVRRTRSHRK